MKLVTTTKNISYNARNHRKGVFSLYFTFSLAKHINILPLQEKANTGKNDLKFKDMDIIKEVRRIASLTPSELTPEDKQLIKEQAATYNIDFKPKSACKSCYIDCAVMIYRAINDAAAREEIANSAARIWRLKDGVDVVWRGIRINAATITDERAEQYVKSGFPTKFFVNED